MNIIAVFRCLILPVIAFLFLIPAIHSQDEVDCPEYLEFCSLGWNKIYMEDDPGQSNLNFFSSNWSASSTNTFYEYPYYYFLIENGIPSSGTFQVTNNASDIICVGSYTTKFCHDKLVFERDNSCGFFVIFKTEDPYPVYDENLPYQVCLGDTTSVSVSSSSYLTLELANEIFTADRLNISNGYLIDIEDYTFKIVWNAPGTDNLELITTDECGFKLATYSRFNIKPKNELKILAENNATVIDICVGESILLNSDAGESTHIFWSISDGRVYKDNVLDIAFDVPGQYTITLDDTNECNCSIPDDIIVNVLEGESPQITCTGSICENTSVTYYSEDFCASYNWSISGNGTITDGGGIGDYFISIDWGAGPEGVVELETPGCYTSPCRESIEQKIPILSPTSIMEGLTLVCEGQKNSYSVPYYTGTNYSWNIKEAFSGAPLYNYSGVFGSNKITASWPNNMSEPFAIIEVEYENCTLGCVGRAELLVKVLPPFSVSANNSAICINDDFVLLESNSIPLNFEIVSPSNISSNIYNVSTFSFQAVEEGVYNIIATNPSNSTCNDIETLEIVVNPLPTVPDGIIDEGIVCQGESARYSIDNLPQNYSVSWKIYDGDLVTPELTLTTQTLTYVWKSAGPYQLEAQFVDVQTGCKGEAISELFTSNIDLVGEAEICHLLTGEYSITNPSGIHVNWSIIPESAGVVIFESNNEAHVLWGEEGNHQLVAEICGRTETININVFNYKLDLISPDSVCVNETGVVIVNAPIGSSIEYYDEEEVLIETGSNVMLGKGNYSVVVNTPANCIDGGDFSIHEYEPFNAIITADGPTLFCLPSPPLTLTCTTPPGTYTYKWYKNNVLLSETSSSLSTNEFGAYYVIATNENGCIDVSNSILLVMCCGDTYDVCPANPMLIDTTHLDCYNKEFEVTNAALLESDTLFWNFDDYASASNYAYGSNVTHEFSGVGFYEVTVSGNKGCEDCLFVKCGVESEVVICESGKIVVIIYVKADFEVDDVCVGVPVEVRNETKKIFGYAGEIYNWDFGDPSSADNTSSDFEPSHVYSTAGTYTINLTVTDHLGCSSTFETEVVVHPEPNITVSIPEEGCQGVEVLFEIGGAGPNSKYKWDFGDVNSGFYNFSKKQNPTHSYVKDGTYTVTLEVKSEFGCISNYTQNVDIILETFVGVISADISLYQCPGDVVVLTAPEGESYLWNTLEETQSISVSQAGSYNVAVETNAGCTVTTDPYTVVDIDFAKLKIFGATQNEGQSAVIHFDSMTVCKDEYFILKVQQFESIIFTWSIGNIVATELNYYGDGLKDLTVGNHEVTVTAWHTITGCQLELDPFIINIIELPETPTIVSSTDAICNDGASVLSVQNPNPDYYYVWSNGQRGTSIVATVWGNLYVTAYAPTGCPSENSNSLLVQNQALLSPWVGGCHEVCFPYTICTRLFNNYDYELIRNETEVTILSDTITEVILSEPGDYELVAISSNGCRSKSEMLTLSAMPDDQSLSGIVFFDENNNGIFEVSDTVLANIPVILCNGNTPVDTTLSDVNGMYSFLNLSYSNLIAKIDLSSTPYDNGVGLDTLVIFDECIEAKEVDFPVVSECFLFLFQESFEVCYGESIEIGGVEYVGGENDTLVYPIAGNCDSIVYLSIEELAVPDVSVDLIETCVDQEAGLINITANSGSNLMFKIDENANWVSNTTFENLDDGIYNLYILSEDGCISNQNFEISLFPIIDIEVTTNATCFEMSNGVLDIFTVAFGVVYSIDGSPTFTSDTHYENLSSGMHTIDYIDEHGCSYQENFEMPELDAPLVNLITEATCIGTGEGILTIEIIDGQDLMFSIDGGVTYSSETIFTSLDAGSFILYFIDANSCAHQLAYTIEEYPEVSFEIEVNAACDIFETGSVSIFNATDELLFSIDNNLNWVNTILFENLEIGTHVVYSLSSEGCIDSLSFEIETSEQPEAAISIRGGCEGENGGTVSIEVDDQVLIAVDNNEFSNQFMYDDLDAGEHTIYFMNEEGCIFDFEFNMFENPIPEVSIETSISCFNDDNGNVEITLENNNFDLEVTTSEGTIVDNLGQMSPGEYIAIVDDNYGCEFSFPFTIDEGDEMYLTATTENTCFDTDEGIITIENRPANSLVSINNGDFEDVSSFDNLGVGTYVLELLDSLSCSSVIEVEILPFEELQVEVPIETGGCFGEPILVRPVVQSFEGEVEMLWNDGSTDLEKLVSVSEKITLVVSDYCSSKTFEFDLEVSTEFTKDLIYLPNIFSPNKDGVNDCFQTTLDPSISLVSYWQVIFDRWGNKMFETDDIDFCWDGYFNGRELEEGVYVYITDVTGNLCDGVQTIRKIGDVTVIK